MFSYAEKLVESKNIRFLGFAFAYIFDDADGLEQNDSSACLFELSLLPPEQAEIEAWILIVAVCSGLLFLYIVIFVLSKVRQLQANNVCQFIVFIANLIDFSADFSNGQRQNDWRLRELLKLR